MPNQSLRCAMFRYQAFHMALSTLRFYALLHPDSIKNGLTTFSQDWRPFCGSELSNVTNGKPWRTFGGITQKQSLKQRGGELCLQMHFGSRYFAIFETSILAADEAQVLIGVKINQK